MQFENQTYMFSCDTCDKTSNALDDLRPRHLFHGFWCDGYVYRQRYLASGNPVRVEL